MRKWAEFALDKILPFFAQKKLIAPSQRCVEGRLDK